MKPTVKSLEERIKNIEKWANDACDAIEDKVDTIEKDMRMNKESVSSIFDILKDKEEEPKFKVGDKVMYEWEAHHIISITNTFLEPITYELWSGRTRGVNWYGYINAKTVFNWFEPYVEEEPRLTTYPRAKEWENYWFIHVWYIHKGLEQWLVTSDDLYNQWNYYLTREEAQANLDLQIHIQKMGVIDWDDYQQANNELDDFFNLSNEDGEDNIKYEKLMVKAWLIMPWNSNEEERAKRLELLNKVASFIK